MGNASSALPYEISEEVPSYATGSQAHWRMHKGSKRGTGEPATVFRLSKTATSPILLEAGKHGFQKIRTLKHPFVLTCLDCVELETEFVLATEAVIPLRDWLSSSGPCEAGKKDEQIAWGMHCLCNALRFLHEDCRVSHSNMCTDAVFVTASGDWKLGALDLLGPIDGSDPFLQLHDDVQPRGFRSPERMQRDWRGLGTDPIHCMDIWALGTLLEEVYPEGLPDSLQKYVTRMHAAAKKRPTAAQYLRCAFLKRPVVSGLEFLDAMAVKTAAEKAAFIEELRLDIYAKQMLEYKVGAVLLRELETAVGSGGAPSAGVAADSARARVGLVLPSLLEMSKGLGDAWFDARLKPLLISLFSLNDRGVRVLLLSRLDTFGDRLDDKSVNNKIFEPLCAGFTDAAAALRELTLKSMVVFIDKLNEKNLNDKLVRHLTRLQGDQEDSIRTNTIIFLGKVSKQLKPSVRDKLLLPAFARGIKDPFPAARLAGLRATSACQTLFAPAEVCCKVLPSVMPCLVDPASAAVRDAAFICVDLYVKRVAEVSAQMKVEEAERQRKEREQSLHGMNAGGCGGGMPGTTAAAPTSSERDRRASDGGWGTWAIGKFTEKLAAAAMGEIGAGAVGSSGMGTLTPPASSPPVAPGSGNGSASTAAGLPAVASPITANGTAANGSPVPMAGFPTHTHSGDIGAGLGSFASVGSVGSVASVRGGGGTGGAIVSAAGNAGWGWGDVEDNDEDGDDGASAGTAKQVGGPSAFGTTAVERTSAASPPSAEERQRRREDLQQKRAARRLGKEKKKGMVLSATKLDTAPAAAAEKRSSGVHDGWEDF